MFEESSSEEIIKMLHDLEHRTRAVHERLDVIEKHMKYAETAMVTKDYFDDHFEEGR